MSMDALISWDDCITHWIGVPRENQPHFVVVQGPPGTGMRTNLRANLVMLY